MTYRRLKKPVIYALYFVGFILIFSSIMLIQKSLKTDQNQDTDYVNKTIFEDNLPVVGDTENIEVEEIINPYTDETVSITKKYYDYSSNEKEQESALIYYEGTYIPSTGLTYKGDGAFDVVSVLSGTVKTVKEDKILGYVIEIMHDNNIISVYQSLSEVTVEENQEISQGQIIAKSGTSNIDVSSENHLYFELIINNETVNPLNYIGKKINEI